MTRMTGGQATVAALEANGVQEMFGIPGMHNLAIYDALIDRPALRHIVVRNEQAASMMANGAARAAGRPGICLVTTGPGASNTLAGVADAARESVPMLVIASQIRSDLIGQNKGAFHEVRDQRGMFEAAGAFALRANRVEQIPAALNAAWVAMTHGRPGPAYVEVPQDVLFDEAEVDIVPAAAAPRPGATPAQIETILSRLLSAQRPVVYVGSGCARADAGGELQRLVGHLGLPSVSTIHGKGVLPDDHPLGAGALPLGDAVCNSVFAQSDLVLALGTGFSEISTHFWRIVYPPELIHVDIDGSQIGRTVPPSLGVVGDARTVLAQLNAAAAHVPSRQPTDWTRWVAGLKAQLAQALAGQTGAELHRILRHHMPRDAILVGDAASWGGWNIHSFPIYGAGQMPYPIHFGTLGFSVAGALGAQAAFPERRVIAACGDGGFLYCAAELTTALQHQLNVLVLVVTNGGFATIRRLQEQRYGPGRVLGADLQNPDFGDVARALGCFGRQVHTLDGFEPALEEALDAGVPAVLELTFQIDPMPSELRLAGYEKRV